MQRNFGSNFQDLTLLADYDSDFDVDSADEMDFLALFGSQDSSADLNGDGNVTPADFDAFFESLGLEIDLNILT